MDHAASHMGETTSSKNKNNGVNESIFTIFQRIGAESDDARIESCVSLVQHLTEILGDVTSEKLPIDLTYSLKRLVRGVGSKNKVVQKGYFTALVAILESFPVITCETYAAIVEKEFSCADIDSKGEEGEALLGQVLAYGAAVRGGLFLRSSEEKQKEIVTTLFSSASKRSYLSYASAPFLHDLMVNVEESVLTDVVWPLVSKEVLKPWADQTLDTLLLLLSALNRVPNIIKSKKIQQNLGFPIFSPESMRFFAQKLVGDSNSTKIKHPVYEEFCKSLCLPDNEALFKTFWTQDVDSLLASSSKSKDHASLILFTILIRKVPDKKMVKVLVTSRILDVIGRTLSGPASDKIKNVEICTKAQEAIASLGEVLLADDATDKVRMAIIKKILFCGDLQYEKQTGSHITILLENKLGKKSVQDLSKQFADIVDGKSSEENKVWRTVDRVFAAQQLKRLIGHQACNDDINWKVEQLLFLLHRGLFRETTSSAFNVELAANVRNCFFRALDEAFSDFKTMVVILNQIVQHINELMANQTQFVKSLRVQFGAESSAAWQQMMKTVSKFAKSESSASETQIFHSLFLFMGLQLFSEPKMAVESLQELHSCYERMKGKHKSKNAEEPQWVEVMVEVLLSLLSNSSRLLRTVVGKVFPHLKKHLTVSAFYQILEVLDPSRDENPLTSTKELDDASESESEDEDEEMPTNGTHNGEDTSDEENEDDDTDDDDDEYEDIDDEDLEETINDKLRNDIRQALGNAASLSDTESVDLDEITEEEGERMNEALAKAFEAMKMSRNSKKKKKQTKNQESVTHFRIRVLDLVDLYISKEPSMEMCLECVAPLLSLMAFCLKDVHQKPLETRTRSVLHLLTKVKKFSSVAGVDEGSLADQIKSLAVKRAQSTTTFLGLSDLISECCTFLVRCSDIVRAQSESAESDKQNPVVNVYEALLLEFFNNRESLLPVSIFSDVLNSTWSGCWCIAPSIVQYAFSSEVRLFRRGQALDLLIQFFNNRRMKNLANDKQKKMLKKIVSSIISHSIELLNGSDDDSSRKAQQGKYIAAALRLLHQILSLPLARPTDVSSLSASVTSFCQNGVPPETKSSLKNVVSKLKLDQSLLKNLKRVDKVQDRETSESKSKKKKNENRVNGGLDSNDTGSKTAQLNTVSKGPSKKEKKMQRMALMAEGFDSVTFSGVNNDALNGMEPSDEEMDVSNNDSSNFNESLESNVISSVKRKQKHSTSEDTQNGKKKKKTNKRH
ncbi:myb-binding protein 1A [Thrips palmi]|uniref:Myb-binding protein 1A n=1 Tax=Thrips palmi TaxID=161013 RepID=A0A6P8YC41_THRPL|nr:myb-binding protein 1A [Thrips palmi]